jgi:putative phosphoesterase
LVRFAVISDVHADVYALRDAFAQIDKLGIEHVLCCGDLIDYGLFPDETLSLFRERSVVAIRGNHDRWAIRGGRDTSGWDLAAASVSYLKALSTEWRKTIDGVRVVLAHARQGSDMKGIASDAPDHELAVILDEAAADILIVGHTHVPFARQLSDGRIVANPGALLRDPGPGCDVATPGTFGVLDVTAAGRQFAVLRAADGVDLTPTG